jgi:hypothetical protein
MFSGSMKGFKAGGSISFDEANASGTGFKLGGRVNKTGPALVHRNEYVLPVGVKPTAEQKKQVKELHKKAKSNK